MHPEQDQIWQFWWSSGGSGGFWRSEEIEGGHFGEVRRLRGVILEGEEIERGYTRWPKATHRGRRPPAREASVPAPQGPRRRAAERLELLVRLYFYNIKV